MFVPKEIVPKHNKNVHKESVIIVVCVFFIGIKSIMDKINKFKLN